jgi:PadR family transcriptional regulator, regulatory protein PadR
MTNNKPLSSSTQEKKEKTTSTIPKNFLVPFLLLSLKGWSLHGYKLIQQLTALGFPSIDQGNVYRTLRQLEKENLISSTWDTNEGGPAKRIYSLTKYGEEYLESCASSFEHYQKMLRTFFTMYTNVMFPFSHQDDTEFGDDAE